MITHLGIGQINDEPVHELIAKAVAAERERCAAIADSGVNDMNGNAQGLARAIARRIRKEPAS